MTDPLGQSQVIPYLLGLKKLGNEILLISCEKSDRFKTHGNQLRNILEAGNIMWFPLQYTSRPPVISTVIDIFNLRKTAFDLIRKHSIEIVHCRSYISALVGQAAKKKFGCHFIFDMRGFWADERVDGGIWNLSNPLFKQIYHFFKRKERQFLLESDQVISLTQLAKKEIHSWKGFEHVPISVIPCCADLNHFTRESISSEQQAALRSALNIHPTDFVISYLGSVGTWYMLDEMLRFYKLLLERKPGALFLFITGDNPQIILEAAQKQGLDPAMIIIHAASRAEVPILASLSTVSIFFIRQAYSKKASSPTKMGELMALGIPLICNENVGDVGDILRDGGNGLLVNEFNDGQYKKVLDQLDQLLLKDPQSTIECANRYYSLDRGIELYQSVYKKLAHS
jgi:glycosyltransferase involved in cell wall biosynthesis